MIYRVVTIDELDEAIDYSKEIFIDSETDGLYGRIVLLQVMQDDWDTVLLVKDPCKFKLLNMLNENTVWHNSHYDLTCVQKMVKMPWIPNQFHDTFLLARLAIPQLESYTLDALLEHVLGFDPYANANLDKKGLQKSNWSGVLSEDQKLYAAIDVYHMPEVWNRVKICLEDINYQLDINTVRNCLSIQNNGMPINQELVDKEIDIQLSKVNSITMPINANSWQQVRNWIKVDKSDDQFLAELEFGVQGTPEQGEKAGRVRKVRKIRKLISFLEKYAKKGDYLYGNLKPSARSGRLTSDKDNIQQIPRALKKVFGYPEDAGMVIIYADYAQLELRTIACIVVEELMIKMFREGRDIHDFTAQMLFGDNFTKDDRNYAKTANFNLLYGGGVNLFISIMLNLASVVMPYKQASTIKTRWLNLWKSINRWQQRGIAAWRKNKLSSTPLGRQYKGKMMTDQLNIENQGAGADVSKLAAHYMETKELPRLREKFNLNNSELNLCNVIHDSFIMQCVDKPEVYQEAAECMARCMQIAWFEVSKSFKVQDLPMPVDVRVGYNWGEIDSDDGFKSHTLEIDGLKHFGEQL